jgi:hypothetical protein
MSRKLGSRAHFANATTSKRIKRSNLDIEAVAARLLFNTYGKASGQFHHPRSWL